MARPFEPFCASHLIPPASTHNQKSISIQDGADSSHSNFGGPNNKLQIGKRR